MQNPILAPCRFPTTMLTQGTQNNEIGRDISLLKTKPKLSHPVALCDNWHINGRLHKTSLRRSTNNRISKQEAPRTMGKH